MQKIRNMLAVRYIGVVLAEVAQGESYVLTSHGRPLALLSPVPEGLDVRELEESPIGRPKAAEAPDGG